MSKPDAAEGARGDTSDTGSPDPMRWAVLAGVWLIYSTFGMVAASLAPLVPPIIEDLAIGHTMMGAIFGAWQLVFIFAAIPCGSLLDRIGVERGLLLGTLAIAASALFRGMASSDWQMLLAVGVFGIGGPIVSTGAPKIIAQWFKGSERGLAMGIYITGPALGGVAALAFTNSLLMPLFDQDWRAVQWFWAGSAVGAGAIWFVLTLHPKLRGEPMGGTPRQQISQLRVVGELLQIRAVQVLMLMSVGIFAINHGLVNWLPEILRAKDLSAVEAGYWATIPTLFGLLGSLLIPRLATRERRHAILLGLCLASAMATICLQAGLGGTLVAGLLLQGIARSSMMTVAMLTLIETPKIGEARAATASGLFFSAAEIGGTGGPLLLGLLHANSGDFTSGLVFLTVVGLLLVGGTLYLKRVSQEAG
ncbi:MAG: MFS transporter [Pseudomonadota bacterium]